MSYPPDYKPEILFEKHPEAMWVYDRHTLRFLAVNDAAINRYGYTRDEFMAMTIADISPDNEESRQSSNLMVGPTGMSFERDGLWRHTRKTGETLYVEVISNEITFSGRSARLVIARDTTARGSLDVYQAQSRLRLANWELDLTHNIACWPLRTYDLVGVDPQSFDNTREAFLNLVHPEDRARYIFAQKRAIRERGIFDEEYRVQHPSGQVRFLREVGEVILRGDRPIFSAVIQNITDIVASRVESRRLIKQIHDILEGMSDGFFMLNRDWRFSYVNRQAATLMRQSRRALEGATLWEMFPDLAGTEFEALFQQARMRSESRRLTERYEPFERWFEVAVYPSSDNMAVYFRDVTDDMNAQQHRNLLDKAIQKLGEVVLITEVEPITAPDGPSIIYVNDAVTAQTGYTPEEVTGQTPRIFQGPETEGPELARLRRAIAEQRPERAELINYTRTGTPYWVEINLSPVSDTHGSCTHFIAIQRDITKRKEAQNALVAAATRDELTGLFNRTVLQETLKQHLEALHERQGSIALLLMDIDSFKNVNDTLGHNHGDALLAEVARRVKHAARGSDLVARMGGDEFMVLAPNSTAEEAAHLAQKLREVFHLPFYLNGVHISLTTSIGVVIAPQDGDDPETLIRNTDIALYQSKKEGRNMIRHFEPSLHEEVVRRTEIEQALQKSLLSDNEDFWLVYQPKVTCDASRKVVGAEALLRWKGPDTGPVGPAEFIPIAETRGLIRLLDHMVIKLAAKQIISWTRAGNAVPVSVNVSAVSMQTEDFARELLQRIDECEVPHSLFRVEIVETVYLDESSITQENLTLLSQAGVVISIDDFGTGHSSLSYLRRLPVQFLKMDRSFVKHIGADSAEDDALAEAILAMANALKISIVAEGVETEAQFDWLAQKGCALIQGFLISEPLEAEFFASRYLE